MMRKIIIFNGPPRCGKDTIVDHLWSLPHLDASRLKLSAPLKKTVQALFLLSEGDMAYAEAHKDDPLDMLFGYTFREMQIKVSEEWMKPTFGSDILGRIAARSLASSRPPLVLCSDGGFIDELVPLHTLVGHANMCVVQVHRPGFDFAGDSRSYVSHPDVRGRTIRLLNDGSRQQLLDKARVLVDAWLGVGQTGEEDE